MHRPRIALTLVLALLAGCGVDGYPLGPPDGGAPLVDGGSDGSVGPGMPDAGGGMPDAGGGMPDAGPSCPDLTGVYAVSAPLMDPCAIDTTATVTITAVGCDLTLTSSGGIGTAVEGMVGVDAIGGFAGASLTLGTMSKSGCTGTWTDATSTLAIACGAGPTGCSATLAP